MEQVITFITEHWDLVLQIIGLAALIAAITPNETDNKIIGIINDIVNTVGMNVGHARNAEEVEEE